MFRQNFGRPIQRNSMSIEKSQSKQKIVQPTITLHSSQPQQLHTPFNGNGALVQQKYSAILKDQSSQTSQPQILLKFTIPPYAGQRKRWLKIRKCQLAYVNFLDDQYPCCYSLCALQVDGIKNTQGTPTKQLCTMALQQLTTNISNDLMTLNMLYKTQDKDQWIIDVSTVPSLQFYLSQQMHATMRVQLPLATHLVLQFSLLRSLA